MCQSKNSGSAGCKFCILKDVENQPAHIASAVTTSSLNNIKAIISPNPTNGRFVISVDNGTLSGKEVYITDMTGTKYPILSINKVSSKKLEIELPASLTSGVYYLNVKINGDYKTLRVIKM